MTGALMRVVGEWRLVRMQRIHRWMLRWVKWQMVVIQNVLDRKNHLAEDRESIILFKHNTKDVVMQARSPK